MTRALWKNTLREIWNTKARFISIFAIIALGVGFFAGIKGTAPAMENTIQQYYQDQNLMDIQLLSTVGFDKNDIQKIKGIKGIEEINAGYMADALMTVEDNAQVVRIHSLPTGNKKVNQLVVTEGRLPEKSGEIAIQQNGSLSVGETITFLDEAGGVSIDTMLKKKEYKIVGMVQSPLYITYKIGTTTIGTGDVDKYAYILPEDFSYDRYTQVYATTKYAKEDSTAQSEAYLEGITEIKRQLKDLGVDQVAVFEEETLEPARLELQKGIAKYEKEKKNAEALLEQSEKDLDKGQKEYDKQIAEAQKKLEDAQKELEEGESLFPYAMTTYYEEILLAQQKISSGELQLLVGKGQLQTAQTQYDVLIAQAETELKAGQTAYDAAYEEFYTKTKPEAEQQIARAETMIATAMETIEWLEEKLTESEGTVKEELLKQLQKAKELLSGYKEELELGKEQLKAGEQKLLDTEKQLASGKAELEKRKQDGKKEIESAQKEIDTAQKALDEGKEELNRAKSLGKAQLDDAQVKLSQGKLALQEGKVQLETSTAEGAEKLEDGREKLKKAQAEAKVKFAEAKDKLNAAQRQLDSMSEPTWHVLDRDDLPSYATFYNDAQSINNVSTVFPLFFLVVAVLVCLTTMTRLLEERRTEIGTLKSLGYSSASIITKYLFYAISAGILGSIAGSVVGVAFLPNIIFDAYKILYHVPNLILLIPWFYILIGTLAAILSTSAVVLFAGKKSLYLYPAKLMRPKAPKPGKRILLERIPFIWKRLNFSAKVTARNLFRYKARFLMTVLGVAGCTALIVAAFGLRDAINVFADKQFNDIFKYEGTIVPQNPSDSTEFEALCEYVRTYDQVENVIGVNTTKIEIQDGTEKGLDANIFVPQSTHEMKKMIALQDRKSGDEVPLTDNGVVLAEKLARVLSVNEGDTLTYKDNNKTYTVKVTGVFENYAGYYVMLSPDYYEEIYGREPQLNLVLETSTMDAEKEDLFAKELLNRDDVMAVSFSTAAMDTLHNVSDNFNIIIYVMIICAAALAFVVLYNLTNINIAERTREIATIKVLGFYNKEVAFYVYRENIILTVVGILAGLGLGVLLTGFLVQTTETDTFMFGREIYFLSYLYAIGLTASFSLFVNAVMYFKMKAINMVDSLKSIE